MNEMIFLGGCPVIRPEGIYLNGQRVIRLGLQGVERTNPLPVGKYWVDVFWSKKNAFSGWLEKNKAALRVLNSEEYPGNIDAGYEARTWYLFQVLSPVQWEGPGLPTVAGADVTTSDDTAQKPPPEKDVLDQIDDAAKAAAKTTRTAVIAGVVTAVVVGGVLIAYYVPRKSTPKSQPAYP
jgi:hypothetical protein